MLFISVLSFSATNDVFNNEFSIYFTYALETSLMSVYNKNNINDSYNNLLGSKIMDYYKIVTEDILAKLAACDTVNRVRPIYA